MGGRRGKREDNDRKVGLRVSGFRVLGFRI